VTDVTAGSLEERSLREELELKLRRLSDLHLLKRIVPAKASN